MTIRNFGTRKSAQEYIVMYEKRNNQLILYCTIKEYKIQNILIVKTRDYNLLKLLIYLKKKSEEKKAKACMDGFSKALYITKKNKKKTRVEL